MPRFIAIPVAQGDAFYFERHKWSVLVDGGRSRIGFPSMFQSVVGTAGVDILICTHNDADHANGVLGFLESGLHCGEVWLPARWIAAMPRILRPFEEVFCELIDEVANSGIDPDQWQSSTGETPLEAYEATKRNSSNNSEMEGDEIGNDGWPESYIDIFQRSEPWDGAPPSPAWLERVPFFFWRDYRRLHPAGVQLLWSAIDAASRIRAIAREAFHRGIPARWFEFDAHHPFGEIDMLRPLNAKVIAMVPRSPPSLLWALALTASNRESLVFWSPPASDHPAVLFAADSDLMEFQLPPQLDRAIITAPHHGSEANAAAYTAVTAAVPSCARSVTWVRSDGRYRARPGNSYLGLQGRRLCTLCRTAPTGSATKQKVLLFARRGAWTRHSATMECTCR